MGMWANGGFSSCRFVCKYLWILSSAALEDVFVKEVLIKCSLKLPLYLAASLILPPPSHPCPANTVLCGPPGTHWHDDYSAYTSRSQTAVSLAPCWLRKEPESIRIGHVNPWGVVICASLGRKRMFEMQRMLGFLCQRRRYARTRNTDDLG